MGNVTRYGRVRAFPTAPQVIRIPSGERLADSCVTGLPLVWRGAQGPAIQAPTAAGASSACAAGTLLPRRHGGGAPERPAMVRALRALGRRGAAPRPSPPPPSTTCSVPMYS